VENVNFSEVKFFHQVILKVINIIVHVENEDVLNRPKQHSDDRW